MNLKMIFTTSFQLSSVGRYSRDHMAKRENVLEHMGFVCLFALLLAKEACRNGHQKIDYEKLMASTVVHDIDEAVLGDIPRTTKYFSEGVRRELAKAESSTVEKLAELIGANILKDYTFAKIGREGEILKVSDIAAVVYKNHCEIELLGNRSFVRVAYETQKYLENVDLDSFGLEICRKVLWDLRNLNSEILSKVELTDEDKIFSHFAGG